MGFYVGIFGAVLVYAGFTTDASATPDSMRPWAAVLGTVLIIAGLVSHYRFEGKE